MRRLSTDSIGGFVGKADPCNLPRAARGGAVVIVIAHPAPNRKSRARSAGSNVQAELTRLTVKELGQTARPLWCALR
jgi:hypothetical protein